MAVADSILGALATPDAEVDVWAVVVEELLDADCCGPSAYTDHALSPPPVVVTMCEKVTHSRDGRNQELTHHIRESSTCNIAF